MPESTEQRDTFIERDRSFEGRLAAFENTLNGIAIDVRAAGELCVEIQNNINAAHAAVLVIQQRLSGCSTTAKELAVAIASPEAGAEDTNGATTSTNLWKRGQDLKQ